MKLRHARAVATWRLAELLGIPIARDARHAVTGGTRVSATVGTSAVGNVAAEYFGNRDVRLNIQI